MLVFGLIFKVDQFGSIGKLQLLLVLFIYMGVPLSNYLTAEDSFFMGLHEVLLFGLEMSIYGSSCTPHVHYA